MRAAAAQRPRLRPESFTGGVMAVARTHLPPPTRDSCAASQTQTELDTIALRQQTNQCNEPRAPDDERISLGHNALEHSSTQYHNHSNEKLDEIRQTTDKVDSFRIRDKEMHAGCYNKYFKRLCSQKVATNELHKNDYIFGNESISAGIRKEIDEYGISRKAAHFKCERLQSAFKRIESIWMPMSIHNMVWLNLGLLIMTLASCAALPSTTPNSKATVSLFTLFSFYHVTQ